MNDMYRIENRKTPTLSDIVFEKLKKAVLEGFFKQGEKLSTEVISKKFNVSRMPVREAFRKLESEGLVVIHPQIGVMVSDISVEEFMELTEMRVLLETYAMEKAVENLSEEMAGHLESVIIEEETELDFKEKISIRNRFHIDMYRLAGNHILVEQIVEIYGKFIRYLYLHANNVEKQEKYNHRCLLEVLKSGDKQKARKLLEEHIRSVSDEIVSILKSQA